MGSFTVSQAATLLGVSPDTVRRWIDAGRLTAGHSAGGRRTVDGVALAGAAKSLAHAPLAGGSESTSARNQLLGIVTAVARDGVMAQVDLACGPYRMVSLMSREAADELGLAVGSLAVATVKATNVVVGLPSS